MSGRSYSIVEYYAEHERYKCGYCKSPNTNFSHGMWAHSLTVQDYQDLIDRGWRRSGNYCYKPTLNQTCCPMYAIKCEAVELKVTKSQRKVIKRMIQFLKNERGKDDSMDTSEMDHRENLDISRMEIPNYAEHAARAEKNISKMKVTSVDNELDKRLHSDIKNAEEKHTVRENIAAGTATMSKTEDASISVSSEKRTTISGIDPSKGPPKKAKLMRIERKQNKLLAQGKSRKEIDAILKESKPQNSTKSLEELFNEVNACGSNKLELRLVRTSPMSSGYTETSKQSYEVFKKYQMTIHGESAQKVTEERYTRFLVNSPLQIKLVRVMSGEFHSTLEESENLYKKYQMAIHGDPPEECDKKTFFNFLVKSPLQRWKPVSGPPQGYGSFHAQYWLNDKLIAVGVLDILPLCVSSVYFFYDPAYSRLSLGTFSCLWEVQFVRQLNKLSPPLRYYYMGFYIHTCPKMRYKSRMKPSKLLCPETYVWYDIDYCLQKLDKEKYCRFNEDIDAIDEDGIIDVERVSVLYEEKAMPYRMYRECSQHYGEDEDDVKEYASLVGMKCAQSLLLYRS